MPIGVVDRTRQRRDQQLRSSNSAIPPPRDLPPPRIANRGHNILGSAGSSCNPSTINDETDRSIAKEARRGSATSLSNPDTATIDKFHNVPILRARRDVPQRRSRGPATIGRHLPIWYSLPSLEAFRRARANAGEPCSAATKPLDFAPMRPGRMQTYKFDTQITLTLKSLRLT